MGSIDGQAAISGLGGGDVGLGMRCVVGEMVSETGLAWVKASSPLNGLMVGTARFDEWEVLIKKVVGDRVPCK